MRKPLPNSTCDSLAKESGTNSERILGTGPYHHADPRRLYDIQATRALETVFQQQAGSHSLMERAGLAVARLALAIAPHARTLWIACGPGNNGGDGLEAAHHLTRWGKKVVITRLEPGKALPQDAALSLARAIESGAAFADHPPTQADACVDALFGIGSLKPWSERCAQWIHSLNAYGAPVLAVDLPSGLDADCGRCVAHHVRAHHTLTLLTLKPGLFTADGRAACGDIWFNSLDAPLPDSACAALSGAHKPIPRAHNTHKGLFGDVAIWGGASGMEGAALLAARAALHAGAGRVYVALLNADGNNHDPAQPELMYRHPSQLDPRELTVVAGCGGGTEIRPWLETLLQQAASLVLDADAINAIAASAALQNLLRRRPPLSTILTPHPLEAARLMNLPVADVQAHRLNAAQTLADSYACVVVLKGSGTIIAAPATQARINPTGNGRLATAGSGDVLAGMIGARLAQGHDAFEAACTSVFHHGAVADAWPTHASRTAQDLINPAF